MGDSEVMVVAPMEVKEQREHSPMEAVEVVAMPYIRAAYPQLAKVLEGIEEVSMDTLPWAKEVTVAELIGMPTADLYY